MRIIIANYRYFIAGGPEKYMFKFMDAAEKMGIEVIPFSVNNPQNEETPYSKYFAKPRSNQIMYADTKKSISNLIGMVRATVWNYDAEKRLRHLIRDTKPDVVYILHEVNHLSPSIIRAARKEKVRVVHRISDFFMFCPKYDFLCENEICEACLHGDYRKAIEHRCVKGSKAGTLLRVMAMKLYAATKVFDDVDQYICTCEFSKNKLIEGGISKDKVTCVPTFIDATSITPCYEDDKYFLFLGRMAHQKGPIYAIEAMKYLKDSVSDDEYHCFIVGSDQVWNPDWAKYTYDRMFLRFCSPTKRISYAASFGVDKIPEKWVDKYKAGLIDFKALSVREDKAVDIVKNTIGITCHKVLDPTMLLERAEWDKIKKMPTKINGKNYILTYFLGGRTREVEKVIYRYAKLTDSAVINLQDYNMPYYTVGPDEFVGLISKAKMVLTDSFHATVFSIIYEKPFVVYDRQGSGKKMGSRLSSLLEMCGLNDRRASALDEKMLLQVDYTNARLAIQKEKVHSLKYLNEAIQSCGDSVG